jgi:hypothetical protein
MRSSPDGAQADSLGEFPIFEVYWDGGAPRNYPYGGTVVKAAFGDGFLVAAGSDMTLAGYDATGALRRIFRRIYESQPISHEDIDAYAEWSSARLRASQDVTEEAVESFQTFVLGLLTPEFKPAVSALLVDDLGNVWAEEFRWVDPRSVPTEPSPSTWSVFRANGRWLTQVRVPEGFLLSAVSGGRVYGVFLGASGSKTVRSYPLNKPQ